MLIGIPTQSSLAAFELEDRMSEFSPKIEAGNGDECVVLLNVATHRLKRTLELISDWAEFWSRGEVHLFIGRRHYCLRARQPRLEWTTSAAPSSLYDVEL